MKGERLEGLEVLNVLVNADAIDLIAGMAVLIGDANAHQCHYATAGETRHHTQQILNGRIAERRDKARGGSGLW